MEQRVWIHWRRRPTIRFQKERKDRRCQIATSDAEKKLADGKEEIEKNEQTLADGQKEVRNNEATIASGDAKVKRGVETVGSKPWPARECSCANRTSRGDFSRKETAVRGCKCTQLARLKRNLLTKRNLPVDEAEAGQTQLAQAKSQQLERRKADLETQETALAQAKALPASDPDGCGTIRCYRAKPSSDGDGFNTGGSPKLAQTEQGTECQRTSAHSNRTELPAANAFQTLKWNSHRRREELRTGARSVSTRFSGITATASTWMASTDTVKGGDLEANAGTLEEGKAKLAEANIGGRWSQTRGCQNAAKKAKTPTTRRKKQPTRISRRLNPNSKAEVDVSKLTWNRNTLVRTTTMLSEAKGSSMKTTAEGNYVGWGTLPWLYFYAVGTLVTVHDDDEFCETKNEIIAGVLKAEALGCETKDVMKKFAVYGFAAVSR